MLRMLNADDAGENFTEYDDETEHLPLHDINPSVVYRTKFILGFIGIFPRPLPQHKTKKRTISSS